MATMSILHHFRDIITQSSLLSIIQHTEFEMPSFTDSKDMIGDTKFKIWVTWPWPLFF